MAGASVAATCLLGGLQPVPAMPTYAASLLATIVDNYRRELAELGR